MILTITMNPSVDISYSFDKFILDEVNRCQQVSKTAGGKGLNVTRVIHQLEVPVMATGVLGGTLGEFIKNQLQQQDIQHNFYEIAAESRNCIAILHEGKQTEILESGPTLSSSEGEAFLAKLKGQLVTEKPKVVTISGSLPVGLAADFYTKIIDICAAYEVPVILDCSGEALKISLQHKQKPFMIKPNNQELSQLLGKEVNEDNLQEVLRDSLFQGVSWIVVSLGSKGAFVKHQDMFYRVTIPKIQVKNPVGSGDATVAGLAVAVSKEYSIEETLKLAMTTGMLNTMEDRTGWIEVSEVENWFEKVKVEKI